MPTAVPPVELPLAPESGVTLRRLSTVGEINEEGLRMRHCVARYALRAVMGACYLYHIEHDGTAATVELDDHLRLQQARGPRNQTNHAVRWVRDHLPAVIARIQAVAPLPNHGPSAHSASLSNR